jgi:DNA-binding SARP family transcriptional activator
VNHELRVLGPWEFRGHGGDIRVPAGRLRVLLTSLALSANQPVGVDTLAEHVWPDRLPVRARGSLHTYVGRLRKLVGSDLIRTQPGGGYRLTLVPEAVDLHRFRHLLDVARQADTRERELTSLRTALSLWRGKPFAELYSTWLDRDVMPRLTEEWLAATVRRIELELDAGPAAPHVAELQELTSCYPTREALWHLLITALHRDGRRAEALDAYQRIHTTLRQELGIEPGERLVALQREVLLDGDPTPEAVSVPVPRQLPHDIAHFTGRATELATLRNLARHDHVPTIVVLDGSPGVGKTSLAVHWAHHAATDYPDGQLYLDLRGHGPGEPVTPATALAAMLRSLGLPGARIPVAPAERAALLRSALAGRRVLTVLDNARDVEQVRPLLPGGPGLVLVTSRDQLRGLAVHHGAHRLTVPPLSEQESVRLLTAIIGTAPASELAALCDGLPLALCVAAERVVRAGSIAAVVAAMAEDRLDPVLRTALSWSYRTLGADAAALFRRLGLHPAGEIGVVTAATLAGAPAAKVRTILDQLVAANLVTHHRPDHYRVPELIRLYAKEMAGTV